MRIVAIHGKAQSGKGTFSQAVRDRHGFHVDAAEVNFADTLKDSCHTSSLASATPRAVCGPVTMYQAMPPFLKVKPVTFVT